jgi:hypothetical protein
MYVSIFFISSFFFLSTNTKVIVKHCTNVQALDEFPKIGEQLNKSLQTADNKAMPPVNICRYKSGEVSEENITDLFGEIICEEGSETVKPLFRSLPVPELRRVGEPHWTVFCPVQNQISSPDRLSAFKLD